MNELRLRNPSQQMYTRAMSSLYRNNIQLHDPSLWQLREPEVEEMMLRDADIAHAVQIRRHMIAGRDWNIVPRVEKAPTADLAVAIATELVGGIKHFTQARLNLARAFFSGQRFARILGEYRTLTIGDGQPRTWWVPHDLRDMDKRMFRQVPHTCDDGKIRVTWERWNIGKDLWIAESPEDLAETIKHTYQDDQATLGHGRALREALGWWWYAKTHVFQESLQAVERFAQGVIHAKIDGARDAATNKPNAEVIEEWRSVLEDMRSRHVLVSSKEDDVEMIKMDVQGWQMLGEIRAELRSTIFTLVLGANLTTAANEGGSYALAEVQENSTEALVQFDRETLEETLTDDLLGCLWWKNHANLVELGIADEKPRFAIKQEKRHDPVERAQSATQMLQAGIPLSMDDVLEQTGWRKPEDGEDRVEPIAAGVGGGDAFGLGGFDLTAPEAAAPEPVEIQETAMNGAQVTAAKEIILDVVNGAMPASTAKLMLVSMFNMDPAQAEAMVNDAEAFQPDAPPEVPPAPPMGGI